MASLWDGEAILKVFYQQKLYSVSIWRLNGRGFAS
jgi:hypothetical protein